MPNFSIALTGLQADSVALNTIGNNLANLNTTAFKSQTTSFEDLFYQSVGTSGAGDPLQVGVGTKVSGTQSNFSQGSLTTTQSATDMAISGNGFFVVDGGGTQQITRAGNFELSSSGSLTTADGQNVMGYGAMNGAVNTNGGLMALALPVGQVQPAQATSNISLTTSLNANSAVGTQFTSPISMYDSLGNTHSAVMTFTKAGANSWNYSLALPAGDASGTPVNNTGTLTFNSAGQLTSPSSNVSGITFLGMADGASDLTVNFNLYSSTGAPLLSQSATASSTSASSQDGFAAGTYQGFSVSDDGKINAEFSNGNQTLIGQIAIASVSNEAGLSRAGGNNYQVTDSSGALSIGVAQTGGRGSIADESLEQSNVDISAEFSNLIVAQRAFEANSKTVTTFDSVTQEAIGMIR